MSTLTVRKLNVDLSRGFARHWLGGDVYRTAFMNALSMSFPLGEQMFIDSVRAAAPEAVLEPKLRAEVKDFVGQEASHRFVHQQYNAELARQGFDYTLEPEIVKRIALVTKLPALDRLAITCAFEHYTAMLADFVLRHPEWMEDADPQMRTLWSWHAAEESEHKAVAFDVYRAAGGGYWKRVLWYLHVSMVFFWDSGPTGRSGACAPGPAPRAPGSAARAWPGTCSSRAWTTCRRASTLGSMTIARSCRCGWSTTTTPTGRSAALGFEPRLRPACARDVTGSGGECHNGWLIQGDIS
jgi:predicted metal-dependent hydrolase